VALRDSGAHPTESLPDAEVAVVAACPALYLVGQVLVRLRLLDWIYWVRPGGAVACILVGVSAPSLACCSRHSCKTASAGAPEDGASTHPSSRRAGLLECDHRVQQADQAGSTFRAA